MGKIDAYTTEYISQPEVFADVFNYYLYNGDEIIRPEQLHEMNTRQLALPYGVHAESLPIQRIRDNIKCVASKSDEHMAYLILAVELQLNTHYAMPVRGMLQDGMQYASQVETAKKSYKETRFAEIHSELLAE